MEDNKLVLTTESKFVHFDLHKDAGINLKHGIHSIIKRDNKNIKNEISKLFSKYKHGNDIHEQGEQ